MKYTYTTFLLVSILSVPLFVSASQTAGTINSSYKYARVCHDVSCSTYGTINFAPTGTSTTSPIVITDTAITGYAWGDELGWINMAPTGAGVTVDPHTGILYGTAFSQTSGWINFRPTNGGVTINSNGEFSGYAWNGGAYGGWIKFDCSVDATCVRTDWRAYAHRTTSSSGGGFSSGTTVTTSTSSTSGTATTVQVVAPTPDTQSPSPDTDSPTTGPTRPVTQGTAAVPQSPGVAPSSPNSSSGGQGGSGTQGSSNSPTNTSRPSLPVTSSSTPAATSTKKVFSYPFIPKKLQIPITLTKNIQVDAVSVVATVLVVIFSIVRWFI